MFLVMEDEASEILKLKIERVLIEGDGKCWFIEKL